MFGTAPDEAGNEVAVVTTLTQEDADQLKRKDFCQLSASLAWRGSCPHTAIEKIDDEPPTVSDLELLYPQLDLIF